MGVVWATSCSFPLPSLAANPESAKQPVQPSLKSPSRERVSVTKSTKYQLFTLHPRPPNSHTADTEKESRLTLRPCRVCVSPECGSRIVALSSFAGLRSLSPTLSKPRPYQWFTASPRVLTTTEPQSRRPGQPATRSPFPKTPDWVCPIDSATRRHL